MGKGEYGYPGINKATRKGHPTRSFNDNIGKLSTQQKPDSDGFISTKAPGKGRDYFRNYYADDPVNAAKDLFVKLGKGGVQEPIYNKKDGTIVGWKRRMIGGDYITYRPCKSSDGSPVIQITINSTRSGLKPQKIHYYDKEKRK